MNYFASLRQDYIAWRLATHGEVQRADILRTFSVSMPQASSDLTVFQAAHPFAAKYNKSLKRYVPAKIASHDARLVAVAEALGWA